MESGPVEVTTGFSLSHDLTREWIKLKTLDEGPFGVVDLVKITKPISCIRAVKYSPFPNPSLSKEYRILQLFKGCPTIVQCYRSDILSIEYGIPYYNLFLEYASGGDLLSLTRKYGGKIPESDVRCYTRMLLEGRRNIHERGYVHCDLKPENILVYDSRSCSHITLKIADFGCAKEPGERDVPNATPLKFNFRATANFMSPESVKEGKITAALDIWSLGCVVAEMMTGEPPWESSTSLEDLTMKIALSKDSPTIPDDMSKAGKDFLRRCLARDPRELWTADRLIRHPFLFPDSRLLAPAPRRRFQVALPLAKGSNDLGTQPVF